MRTINYTTARRNLASAMHAVIEDHTPVIITKGSDKAVVMMSLDDWNAWQETMHLLRNPANAERLLKATRDFAEGKTSSSKSRSLSQIQTRSMDPLRFYGYLVRARRDLWAALEAAPAEVLAEPRIPGERFHCIKDLLVHIAAVEDSWLNEDILRVKGHWESVPAIVAGQDGPHYAAMPLADILAYWRAVEASTQTYLARLTPSELTRRVTLHDDETQVLSVEDILWHVLQHEVRHTAQIVLLLRQAGLTPPALDLLFYLPLEEQE